ncbi:MAG: tetratricopeptide repeat protein [Planctomycetota bacterium]
MWLVTCVEAVLAGVLTLPLPGDQVLLLDGRIVEAAVELSGDAVTLKFKNGDITIPRDQVKEVYYEDLSRYLPQSDEEKEQLAKGFVKYEGRWISKDRLQAELQKRQAALEERLQRVKEHQEWRNALVKTSKHFKWTTNCAEEIVDQYIEIFEAYYEYFAKEFKLPKSPEKTEIYIYRNRKDFHQISGAPGGALGFFRPSRQDVHFFHDPTADELPLGVLFHEGNHLLVSLMNPGNWTPHWISEGMAEYFGGSSLSGGKFVPGGIQNGRLVQIKEDLEKGRRVGIEDLIRKSSYDSYTWGWSFVHYMMNSPKHSPKFMKYFDTIVRGKGVKRERGSMLVDGKSLNVMATPDNEQIELLRKTMGVKSFAELEKGWYEYVEKELNVEPGEGDLAAAEKFCHESKYEEAYKWVEKAIQAGLDTPTVFGWKGRIAWKLNKIQEAIEAYQEAIDRDPLRASYYFELGRCYARKEDAASKEEAKRLKLLAGELDPDIYSSPVDIEAILSGEDE